ncbi:hypothetical protein [Pelotalea chapellei]|uniref:Uncharacterized protein n=1 Tax=Pelotalea chapellei TaxID=44671 RepID=A0ABS5U8T9_9BACT|nr:hypothetical protein [Pelotalea chapellei]MBT1072066.1 hypothetical protein [Pelotalea chapellei]
MHKVSRIISAFLLISFLAATPSAFAEESALKEVFHDALYGGAIGTLVGAALMAFTKKPADNLNYMAFGAASGVLAGTAYGVGKTSTRALASIENGKVKIAVPTIMPDLIESPVSKQTIVSWRADILRGTFN